MTWAEGEGLRKGGTHTHTLSLLPSLGMPAQCGATPLHASADNGHVEVVKALLDAGANMKAAMQVGSPPTASHIYAHARACWLAHAQLPVSM